MSVSPVANMGPNFSDQPSCGRIRAEQDGIKGMRILLHPSVFNDQAETASRELRAEVRPSYVPISDDEAQTKIGVLYEVNYLAPDGGDEDVVRAVHSMKYSGKSGVEIHYNATLAALENMRLASKV